jgi:hypothetical protein
VSFGTEIKGRFAVQSRGFWEKVDLRKGDNIETDLEKEREGVR